ncbi:MAG: pentapeptide repeat-containing protein [Algibacter sp.]|uniref:pentapeptide repeat-containing protein n=1 Tax=Algibacter sp. TaxID=1872428 RepID=UPI0032999ACB
MNETNKRLNEIEEKLIEQEHRPIQVITNYLFRNKKWSKGDGRITSSKKALIWRIFFSPGVVAGTGGIIALISIFILHLQNNILLDQNDLIEKQNNFFREQILSDNIRSSRLKLQSGEAFASPVLQEAFKEYVSSKKIIAKDSTEIITVSGVNLNGGYFINEPEIFRGIEFRSVNFNSTNFFNVDFSNSTFINCTFQSEATNNPFINDESLEEFDLKIFSPTRFENCKFENLDFKNTRFDGAIFKGCDINNLISDEANFSFNSFVECTYDDSFEKSLKIEGNIGNKTFSNIDQAFIELKRVKIKFENLAKSNYENYHLSLVETLGKNYQYKQKPLYRLYDRYDYAPKSVKNLRSNISQFGKMTVVYYDFDVSALYESHINAFNSLYKE